MRPARADNTTSITLLHLHPDREPWRPGPPEPEAPACPGCGGPLEVGPVGPTEPDRLLGVCRALRCGEVVTFRRFEGRPIVADRRRIDRRRP
jgi:hypothetical protein